MNFKIAVEYVLFLRPIWFNTPKKYICRCEYLHIFHREVKINIWLEQYETSYLKNPMICGKYIKNNAWYWKCSDLNRREENNIRNVSKKEVLTIVKKAAVYQASITAGNVSKKTRYRMKENLMPEKSLNMFLNYLIYIWMKALVEQKVSFVVKTKKNK